MGSQTAPKSRVSGSLHTATVSHYSVKDLRSLPEYASYSCDESWQPLTAFSGSSHFLAHSAGKRYAGERVLATISMVQGEQSETGEASCADIAFCWLNGVGGTSRRCQHLLSIQKVLERQQSPHLTLFHTTTSASRMTARLRSCLVTNLSSTV